MIRASVLDSTQIPRGTLDDVPFPVAEVHAGRIAVNKTAFTPYASAEFWVDAFRNLNCGTTTERTRVKPDSSNNLNISPSRRAPPIQLAHSLGSLTIDCESCFALTMSVIEIRPPGFSTRKSS